MKKSLLFLVASFALSSLSATPYPPLPLQYEQNKTIIPFNTSFPLIGEHSIIGRQMLAGIENYLREYKHFTSEVEDSSQKYILKLVKNNKEGEDKGLDELTAMLPASPLFLGLIGTELFTSLLPNISNHRMALLFPLEGDSYLRNQKLDNVIYFRPSYEKELRVLAKYALNNKHKNSIAIFHEASNWGNRLLATLKALLKEYNITPVVTASYAQGTVDVEQALQTISKATPNAVFCCANPRPAYAFISNALNVGLHECLFLGLSQLAVIQKLLKTSRGLDIAVTAVVPDAKTSKLPIIQEYKRAMKTFLSFRDDSPFYLEAFINIALFEYCLKKIKSPITIEAIMKQFESYNHINFKGLDLSFDPSDRSLSSALWINPGVDREWISCE